ncbi:MAG: YdcF family protein [Polaromonas sp.]|nr:YdcF family protein [Polaromonas sp.]
MMPALGEFKAIAAALLLPPTSPLLLAAAGLIWLRHSFGRLLMVTGLLALWLLSCNAVAVWLAQRVLPPVSVLEPSQQAQLGVSGVQAIVVLGGGVQPSAPEYGQAQPNASTAARLRYAIQLAKRSSLPLAFAGGVGWSNSGQEVPSEASTAQVFTAEHGLKLRWTESQSRDTAENAARLRDLLAPAGIQHIALVTHAWHMSRSQALFEKAGFTVLPAPMGLVRQSERPLLEWLPSAHGLTASRHLLREWLALRLHSVTG